MCIQKQAVRLWALSLCAALLPALFAVRAFASPVAAADGVRFQATLPKEVYYRALEAGDRVKLLWLEEQTYTLSLGRVQLNGEAWVRAIITTGEDVFVAAAPLARLTELADYTSLRLDCSAENQGGTTMLSFAALPNGTPLAVLQLPLRFPGAAVLIGAAAEAGAELRLGAQLVPDAPVPTPQTEPQGAAETPESKALPLVFLALLLVLLTAVFFAATFRRQLAVLLTPLRKKSEPYLAKLRPAARMLKERIRFAVRNLRIPERGKAVRVSVGKALLQARGAAQKETTVTPAAWLPAKEAAPAVQQPQYATVKATAGDLHSRTAAVLPDAAPFSGSSAAVASAALAGVTLVTPEESGAWVETIHAENPPAEEPAPPDGQTEIAAMNAYFTGKAAAPPPGLRLQTVGLRNREQLLAEGAQGKAAPVFALNPRGQVFSVSSSGRVYLHADYFSPPSFVVRSVLSNVCLERVFRLEDAQGLPLRVDEVRNRKILHITPAITEKTPDGDFTVAEKGRLTIGAI
ncbi:MAG: hypothetical protein LBC83_02910 [Oscillospiraceae bacterium]|jgi:hypothetical protein|nr:hypothetical protein [Oscillospiraceae bacterium]